MLGKKLINAGPVATGGANTFASENFETVTYTGNGGTQRIGGYINRGGVFNGSSYINTTLSLNSLTDYTISFWLKASQTQAQFVLGTINSSGNTGTYLITQTNGTIIWEQAGAGNVTTTDTYVDGAWNHITLVRNGGTNYVYINNGTPASASISSVTHATNLVIGRAGDFTGAPIVGGIDQVRIFNKALSSSEVTTLYGETYASSTISTTDIFSDNSAVALYQLDGNANDTGGVSGKFGSAAIFNGSSSRISISQDLGIGNISQDWTISFWAQTNATTLQPAVYARQNNNFSILVKSDALYYDFYQSSSASDITISTDLTDFIHLAFVHNASAGTITPYINGTPQTSKSTSSTQARSESAMYFGSTETTSFGNLKLDDVRIYSDVLTSTEVGYIYNNTTASIPTDNLVAYYKLDGDARDEQQQYDGTATNVSYAYDGTATNVTYQEATKFQPDLVWIKYRNVADNHQLVDSVRGNTKYLIPNSTNAESTSSSKLTSFDTNGFSLSSDTPVNANNGTYVAWCFKGGGTAVSNTDGTLTSQVSANQDAGFSIVEFTSPSSGVATIGTGLNQQAELVIAKVTNTAADWPVYVNGFNTTDYLILNTTAAKATYVSDLWNLSNWSTNLIGCHRELFGTSNSVIAYCFHSVEGYSKVGSYTGTGTANNIIETGFEPAWLMIKRTDSTSRWRIVDNKRNTSNPRDTNLFAEDNIAETSGNTQEFNFLSNGFEIPDNQDVDLNASGGTFIYLAIAADPDTTTPTVENSFDVVTWTGDGTYPPASDGSDDTTVYADFKPDLIWAKDRNGTISHILFDSVRGNNRQISSNTTDAETVRTNDSYIINEDGFTVSTYGNLNNATDYVAWCWKAGDHDDNLPQINTEGSIDSVVSVNAAAGFSIVKYTGQSAARTVGHGLSSTPEMVIIKNLDDARNWMVYHKDLSASSYIFLNLTNAEETDTRTNGGQPRPFGPFTSTTFGVNIDNETGYTNDYIAYCFHSVSGYQKVGSYTGNTSGVTVTTGFKPRFIMIKRSDSTGNWFIYDTVRSGGDTLDDFLHPNLSAAESTNISTYEINATSTGFNVVGTGDGQSNSSGGTHIYLAIA